MAYFTSLFGTSMPILAAAGSVFYGMSMFGEQNAIKKIGIIEEGEHAGSLRITIATSPLVTHDIIAKVSDVYSIVALGSDNLGADDCESNVVAVKSYLDAASGEQKSDGVFVVPGDAFRDREMMDWILSPVAQETTESTDDLFNDLMASKFNTRVEHGKANKLRLFSVEGEKTSEALTKIGAFDSMVKTNTEFDSDARTRANLAKL
jgi:hypothetical protein